MSIPLDNRESPDGLPDQADEPDPPSISDDPPAPSIPSYHPVTFTQFDMLLLICITFISFWTRHFSIALPDSPVFDETHFGHFTNHYVHGDYFFDIHPPVAKLILYAFAVLNQYGGHYNFSDPKTYPGYDYVGLRQIPALFASFCAPFLFVAGRCFGLSTIGSFTIAFMTICDNSMIVEGRFILTDGILHCFVCLAIAGTASVRTQLRYSFCWWLALIFNGLAVGCAVSSKFTSLSLLPFVAIVHTIDLLNEKLAITMRFLVDLVVMGFTIGVCIVFVFFVSFSLHLMCLPYRGDSWQMMPHSFWGTLFDKRNPNANWRMRTQNQSLVGNIVSLNRVMHRHNMAITADHPYGSKWHSWPFLTGKWVLFWTEGGSHIMCQGQVFNVYCGTLSVIGCFVLAVIAGLFWRKLPAKLLWNFVRVMAFPIGYCSSLFPFAAITRGLFFYHYIIPNIFGMLTWVSAVDLLMEEWPRAKAVVLTYTQVLTGLAFFFWAVWSYGIPMEDFDIRLWTKKWQG
jgi:dolichyl-phosphate-mannose--protein O-mannosyl transferase